MSKTIDCITRTSERNKQLGLKIREELYWEIKELAFRKRCHIVEVIEESVNLLKEKVNKS